jgi:hypothetical protein
VFHPDHGLDGISWCDSQLASCSDIELENVLDTDVSVLTTELLFDFTILRRVKTFVPLIHLNNCSIFDDLPRLSTWVSDSNCHTSFRVQRLELEQELLGR